jgi:glycosyltransferase involved in cell wall biosynthesis
MNLLVTIGIPIYKRVHYLPHILKVVERQDYPEIELLISDNGMNGTKVLEMVAQHYSRPYKFRQNAATVSISKHYNQLVDAASGKYFVLLCDDDSISENFVSELAARLEQNPSAAAAVARQEIIDESDAVVAQSAAALPDRLSGPEFINSAWRTHKYGFKCFATFMGRTDLIKRCGAYPDFTTGTHNDDALLIKLCLAGDIALSDRCCFRWRQYDSSHGWSISIADLAKASREFLHFLKSDPAVLDFARRSPRAWADTKSTLVELGWTTYYWRWAGMYRRKLPTGEWLKAAFALPFIPAYYGRVARTIFSEAKSAAASPLKRRFPQAYEWYMSARGRRTL